ncbi:putative ATPase (AAA+ superfamily) [Thermoanaerobacterium thermosaccharolyticum]|uniref:Putative ATPase (AAA+ superfamily) n=1 Tax=Thermoanaerobacterium thermosaccharolyticum TaxID=1517 RepID=A0A223I045_THETR|nr:ATP-binding protein [Thermoanaerobacterium thermosaccharolyticum]AST58093.1 putative ATPase (AAA+ superfamily) [Thermoanaerobacterium thermosaccharolyticum]
MTKQYINELIKDLRRVVIYKNVLNDDTVKKFVKILEFISDGKPDVDGVYKLYSELYSELTKYAVKNDVYNGIWKSKINDLVKVDENIFSLLSEKFGKDMIDKRLKMAAEKELETLKKLADVDLIGYIEEHLSFNMPPWENLINHWNKGDIADILDCKTIDEIIDYYNKNGCGLFNRYRAFRWDNGELIGVEHSDPVEFDDLIGYEEEHRIVIDNTNRFMRGLPASNILLYGDRGTGKSSTVKAVLNMYYIKGLRLIEVSRQDMMDLNKIINIISSRGLKFILFLDDLSFEENETEYKILKSTLEGGIEKLPENVIIYATSNRRHLIREYLDDSVQNELHLMDTKEEKLSLADRFGITITFMSPNQEGYLKIVESLAQKYGISLDMDTLKSESLRWCAWHNGMSPRSAKQFIDYIRSR